ncbi:MAG: TonB-dependent receptor, partial [Gemmatimonadota bacterium]
YEVGINRQLRRGVFLDVAAFERDIEHQSTLVFATLDDPARAGNPVDIRLIADSGFGKVKGMELRLEGRLGVVRGSLGYTYQDATASTRQLGIIGQQSDSDTPANDSRPHAVAGLLLFDVPEGWQQGKLSGRLLSRLSFSAGFRYASGTPYTRCTASTGNESVLAGDPCFSFEGDASGSRLPSVKQLDLRITKGFRVGGQDLVAYLDGRNVLNFNNVVTLFAVTGQTSNPVELARVLSQDSASWANEAQSNGLYSGTGDIDLGFGGAVASGCGNYINAQGQPAAPSCVYLIRAEERFGDGDHVFTVAEQRRASKALYDVGRSSYLFHSTPRRLRLGLELRF